MAQPSGGRIKTVMIAQHNGALLKKIQVILNPSSKDFMFNYRVENLERLLDVLNKEGVTIVGEMETYDYGKFAWILDNENNKIELWEPIDAAFT
jgi:predicted enzyme related to lactoylglutathione lyase